MVGLKRMGKGLVCLGFLCGGCVSASDLQIWRSCADVYQTKNSFRIGELTEESVNKIIQDTINDADLHDSVKVAVLYKAQYVIGSIYSQFNLQIATGLDSIVRSHGSGTEYTDYNAQLLKLLIMSQTEGYKGEKIKRGYENCILEYVEESIEGIVNSSEKMRFDSYFRELISPTMFGK
jgi:hypothetical protein